MMHKLKRIAFGDIHINNHVFNRDDFFLFNNLVEPTEKSHSVTKQDFSHMMLREPEIIIIGTGFNNAVKINEEVYELAKKSDIRILELPTPEALKRFQELSKKRNVAARIHITC
jgi:hypothetical protein